MVDKVQKELIEAIFDCIELESPAKAEMAYKLQDDLSLSVSMFLVFFKKLITELSRNEDTFFCKKAGYIVICIHFSWTKVCTVNENLFFGAHLLNIEEKYIENVQTVKAAYLI